MYVSLTLFSDERTQSAENHRIFPSFFRTLSISLELGLTPSGLFSLRLTFERSKSESLRDVKRNQNR